MSFIERYSLWLLITLQILVWGVIAPAFHTALPLDVAELMTLSGEGVIANYKHPNLPGLLLDLFIGLTGKVEVVYLLSQLSIVVAYKKGGGVAGLADIIDDEDDDEQNQNGSSPQG